MEYLETEEVMAFKGSEQKPLKSKAWRTPKPSPNCPHRICPFQRDEERAGEWYSFVNDPHVLLTDKTNHTSSFSLKVQAWDATHPRTDGEHKVAFKVGPAGRLIILLKVSLS